MSPLTLSHSLCNTLMHLTHVTGHVSEVFTHTGEYSPVVLCALDSCRPAPIAVALR